MKRNTEYLECLICRQKVKNLGQHFYYSHKDMTPQKYYDNYIKCGEEDICPVCGKQNAFRSVRLGYSKHCSARCAQNDRIVRAKQENTNMKKWGSLYACNSEYSKNKSKATKLERYGDEKYNNAEQMRKTKLDKYGYYYNNSNKRATTNVQKYGYVCSAQNRDVRLKIVNSLKKNGNKSSLEDILENFFNEHNIDYIQEYKDDRYPYFCDFYLPHNDTFIEINGYWMHGGHFFDKNNPIDVQKLSFWKEKLKNGFTAYEHAIHTWTVSDVEKLCHAKNSNINYVVLWNKNDIENYISSYKI